LCQKGFVGKLSDGKMQVSNGSDLLFTGPVVRSRSAMDALAFVDFMEYVVYPSTLVIALLLAFTTRFWRVRFQRKMGFNKIFALSPEVNQLIVIPETSHLLTVWTADRKRLFRVERIGNIWYIQNSASSLRLVSLKNGYWEKFILLLNTGERGFSPLNTSPSILKVERRLFTRGRNIVDVGRRTDFSFGNAKTFLRWVGLNYLEIVLKESDRYISNDSQVIIHQRVAICKEFYDGHLCGYLLYFDFDKINIEVLISTFLFSILDQKSRYRGILTKPKRGTYSSRIKNYLKSKIFG
jgi:hypothetical protein